MAVEPKVLRRYGSTAIPAWADKDVKDAVFTWGWLLPRNGRFSLRELAVEIRKFYDAGNPKTAHDLAVLEGPVRTFEEVIHG